MEQQNEIKLAADLWTFVTEGPVPLTDESPQLVGKNGRPVIADPPQKKLEN